MVFRDFFAAYDASGSESDPEGTLVVAAMVAHSHKWERFEREWKDVLDTFEVPYLHLKELNHRHSGAGVYAKWKDDDDTPRQFLQALIKVLLRGVNKTFLYATVLQDYQRVNRRFKLLEGQGSPYVLTAGACYVAVDQWMASKRPGEPRLHIFEEGDNGQKGFTKLLEKHGQSAILLPKNDPRTGEPWPHFQAADLVAGTYRNAAGKMGMVTSFDDYGEVFNTLVHKLPQRSKIWHFDTLLAMCLRDAGQFPRRA